MFRLPRLISIVLWSNHSAFSTHTQSCRRHITQHTHTLTHTHTHTHSLILAYTPILSTRIEAHDLPTVYVLWSVSFTTDAARYWPSGCLTSTGDPTYIVVKKRLLRPERRDRDNWNEGGR